MTLLDPLGKGRRRSDLYLLAVLPVTTLLCKSTWRLNKVQIALPLQWARQPTRQYSWRKFIMEINGNNEPYRMACHPGQQGTLKGPRAGSCPSITKPPTRTRNGELRLVSVSTQTTYDDLAQVMFDKSLIIRHPGEISPKIAQAIVIYGSQYKTVKRIDEALEIESFIQECDLSLMSILEDYECDSIGYYDDESTTPPQEENVSNPDIDESLEKPAFLSDLTIKMQILNDDQTCAICKEKIGSPRMAQHNEISLEFQCSNCNNLHSIQCHLPKCKVKTDKSIKENEGEWKCNICNINFQTKSGLSQHKRHAHPDTRNSERIQELNKNKNKDAS
nr:PREDICTED: uncharacterized protein LOC107079738 [Lepisosteus oculatus]XP_015221427.1 PREDICTED: uncharacterized protein LOC107079738 [Lepisosteus oculatus]XP_015221428.1 PREDICTED: uncharacterized protein LOC107079738 [Lepisosteus oculatus]